MFQKTGKPCEFPGVEFLKDCSSEKEVCLDALKSSMKRRIVWLWKWNVLKIMTNVVVLIT